MHGMANFRHIKALSKAIGSVSTGHLLARRCLGLQAPVKVATQDHILRLRPTDQDMIAAGQVFGTGDLNMSPELLSSLNRIAADWQAQDIRPVIIDTSASIGCSSLLFANAFPDVEILSIEPDAETISLLIDNCASVPRIHAIHGTLVSLEVMDRGDPKKSCDWAITLKGRNSVATLALETLLTGFYEVRPLIIKLDTVGAEIEVNKGSMDVFGDVPCVLVEPKDRSHPAPKALSPLIENLVGRNIDTLVMGDNLCLLDPLLVRHASY